ncbi:hypothetical protein BCR35DRAFT_309536, partial [Leucosporidium creatinivorum]
MVWAPCNLRSGETVGWWYHSEREGEQGRERMERISDLLLGCLVLVWTGEGGLGRRWEEDARFPCWRTVTSRPRETWRLDLSGCSPADAPLAILRRSRPFADFERIAELVSSPYGEEGHSENSKAMLFQYSCCCGT